MYILSPVNTTLCETFLICGTFRRCIQSGSDLVGVNISTSFIFSVLAYLLYSGHCLHSSF